MFETPDPYFETRIRASFAKQGAMQTIGASLATVAPGEVEIHLPMTSGLTQQHGFLHAGMLSAALDSACGYAASTVMPAEAGVLTVEFKVNLMAPGDGDSFILIGRVSKPGRTIVFAEGEAFAVKASQKKRIATMSATCMVVHGRETIKS
jgi:uncharacterized protein (TIGR00369 family)